MSQGCEMLMVLSTHCVTLALLSSDKVASCCQSSGVLGTGGMPVMSIL